MRKLLLGAVSIALMTILIMPAGKVSAWSGQVTDSPSSLFALGQGDQPNSGPVFGDGREGALQFARLRDSGEACLWSQYYDQYIATAHFTNPLYDGWPEQNLPTENATIDWVSILLVGHGVNRNFNLAYALNVTNWDILEGTVVWQSVTGFHTETWDPVEFHLNITGSETSWTPTMLKHSWTWTRVYSTDRGGHNLYIDYLGLEYGWHYPGGSPPGGSNGTFNMSSMYMSIPGAFGTIGFIGMTVCPAYAIMQWRQGGEDRVTRFIMSIAAMLVFFTLFLASLGA